MIGVESECPSETVQGNERTDVPDAKKINIMNDAEI